MLKVTASSRFHTIHPDGRFSSIEMVEHFKKVGFEGIDYDLNEFTDIFGEDRFQRITAMADHAHKLGLALDVAHLPFYKRTDERSKNTELYYSLVKLGIDGAAAAGIRDAVIHTKHVGMQEEEFDEEHCFKVTVEHLTPLAEYAVQKGVVLAIENMTTVKAPAGYHRYCTWPAEIARVADYFGMKNCWDFGHANSVGVPQGDALRYLGKRISVLHVNDNLKTRDDHLLPFWGNIDWHDAMQGLRDSGFDGCFNYECRMQRIPAALREEAGRYAVSLGRYLQTY